MIKAKILIVTSALLFSTLAICDRSGAQSNSTPLPTPESTTEAPNPAASEPGTTVKSNKMPSAVSEILDQLDLTPEQKPKVENIQAIADAQIKGILNTEQLKQLKVLADEGKADSEAFKSLNLSPEQQTKLNEVQLDVGQQLFAVLTADQQKKLFEWMMARTKTP